MMKPMVRRTATIVTATAVGVLTTAGPALAHVTVDPAEAGAGSYVKLTFKVPNESDDAATTKLEVDLPENAPFASVQTQPVPGWDSEIEMADLDEPLDMHGREINEAASTITWTAEDDDAGIQTDEFGEFSVNVGPLPEEAGEELIFKTIQTYSDDSEAAWIDEPEPDGSEPEEPAPFVTVTEASEDDEHGHGAETGDEAAEENGGTGNTAVILSAVAAALSFIAVVVAVLAFKRKSA